jgi:uncharacterized ubiquitin-like protein YukD
MEYLRDKRNFWAWSSPSLPTNEEEGEYLKIKEKKRIFSDRRGLINEEKSKEKRVFLQVGR